MADSKNVLMATDSDFEDHVMKSSQLALVDFWAEWCGPCKQLGPTIAQIADEYIGKVKVYKLNVDEYSTVASKFNIRGIPTMILFKDGQKVDELAGNRPKSDIVSMLEKHI